VWLSSLIARFVFCLLAGCLFVWMVGCCLFSCLFELIPVSMVGWLVFFYFLVDWFYGLVCCTLVSHSVSLSLICYLVSWLVD